MIRKLLLSLIKTTLILFFIFNLSFSQQSEYRLQIISERSFELFLNDVFQYRGNLFDTLLNAGKYKIEAYLLNSEPKFSIYKKEIDLISDTIINFNQIYPFTLRTKPSDALVFIDSIFFGYTPLNLNLLFKPRTLTVKLNSDYKTFDLEKFNNYDFEIDFGIISKKKKTIVDYKYIALTSTIINGILSAYYKQKADKFFYKTNRTQSDFDIVKKYDAYSAAFTIGMEISFGIFVYLLFNE